MSRQKGQSHESVHLVTHKFTHNQLSARFRKLRGGELFWTTHINPPLTFTSSGRDKIPSRVSVKRRGTRLMPCPSACLSLPLIGPSLFRPSSFCLSSYVCAVYLLFLHLSSALHTPLSRSRPSLSFTPFLSSLRLSLPSLVHALYLLHLSFLSF